MGETYQENNLDIGGRLIWRMAPLHLMEGKPKPPFVVTESGKFFARPQFYSRREGVEGHLFIYTQHGKGLLEYQGGEHKLLPGSIALVDCRQRHEYRTYDDVSGDWTFHWLHCLGEGLGFYAQLMYGESFSPLDAGEKPIHHFEEAIGRLQYSDPDSLLALHGSVDSLLALMMKESRAEKPATAKESEKRETIANAVRYLRENYWMPFDLDELAAHFGISKYYFVRLFKEHTGMTPHSFVTAERLSLTKILLQSTDEPMSQICLMTGFGDESNFMRKFRELTGETPGAYRSRMRRR